MSHLHPNSTSVKSNNARNETALRSGCASIAPDDDRQRSVNGKVQTPKDASPIEGRLSGTHDESRELTRIDDSIDASICGANNAQNETNHAESMRRQLVKAAVKLMNSANPGIDLDGLLVVLSEIASIREPVIIPEKWNGKGDISDIDYFLWATDLYFKRLELPAQHQVEALGTFLTGKARKWFTLYVLPNIHEWTIGAVKKQMFEFFFPKRMIRAIFEGAKQGDELFSVFAIRVKRLAAHLEVTERYTVWRIWEGAKPHLSQAWIEGGYDCEFSSLEEITSSGEAFDRAEQYCQWVKDNLANPQSGRGKRAHKNRTRHHKIAL